MTDAGHRRWSRGWPWDPVVVAVGLILVVLISLTPDDDLPAGSLRQPFNVIAGLLLAASVAAAITSRRLPLVAVVVTVSCNALWHEAAYEPTVSLINALTVVALYAAGSSGVRRVQVAAAFISTVPLPLIVVVFGGEDWRVMIDAVGWGLVSVLFGVLAHNRRQLTESYRQRAEQAEAERDAEARRQVAEERLRIARDLHDVVGHTVSVMLVQAGVAGDALPEHPEKAQRALQVLRTAGRQATTEVRATIELLREGGAPDLAPTPGVAELHDVLASSRALGLQVNDRLEIDESTLPPLIGLTIHRVVQEALTNVARHAEATTVTVTVRRCGDHVMVSVADDGRGPAAGYRPGTGLTGMVERVALADGELHHGPGPDGGFVLEARLPLPAPRPVVAGDGMTGDGMAPLTAGRRDGR